MRIHRFIIGIILLWVGILTGCATSQADQKSVQGISQTKQVQLPSPETSCELRLELPPVIRNTATDQALIRLTNVGSAPVTLVKPGDGSDCRWRTPVIGWSVLPVDSLEQHPKEPPRRGGARCGNINRLEADEIFVLQPGEEQVLKDWIAFPYRTPPGIYRVVFYYSNVPEMKWSGLPLGNHDEEAMQRLRSSTPLSLVSNEVQVEITD